MAFNGRVVKTYGRHKQKKIKQDNWISPNLATGRKISNVFSSPENTSGVFSDASIANISEKENIDDATKKPKREAARKANAAFEVYTLRDEQLHGAALKTSTPFQAHQRVFGQSIENKGCRQVKQDQSLSSCRHGRRHKKRQRKVSVFLHDLSIDEPRRKTTRHCDSTSDLASRLFSECSIKLDRLSSESSEELGNGSMDLFDSEDQIEIRNAEVQIRSCQVSLEKLSLSSGIVSDAADESKTNISPPVLRKRTDAILQEPIPRTPLVNKSISRLALDSFKVALTPTKNQLTGQLLSPRSKVLAQCDQDDYINFSSCMPSTMMNKCVKIGEGVYGEVFRSTNRSKASVALKVIPVEGDFPVNEESQKPFEEILPEIVISRELSMLQEGEDNSTTNFIQVNRVSCVKGSYPKKLLNEWDKYDKRKTSENDRPDLFPSEQLFIIFQFADGGSDLESFEFENIYQAVSVIRQVTGALAVAERELDFEHRDLHWGNVLVRPIDEDQVTFMIDGQVISIKSHGLHVSIIDFTLSRLQKDDCTVFCDLAEDPTLFTGDGDKQFDVYRSMKEHNNNQWESFKPKTNVFWIEYLLDKIIKEKRYPMNRSQRKVLGELKGLMREVLDYSSAEEVLRNSELLNIG